MTTEKKRYRVYLTGVASTTVEVEVDLTTLDEGADPLEAALEEAYRENQASLCHHCARHMEEPSEWIAGSWTPREEPLAEVVEEVA